MSEVTLRQLQYFLAAVDLGSITAAAEHCHISQAAASMAISQLEKAVGAPLLVRHRSRRVVPTPAGREFAVHARGVLDRLAEARESVAESLGAMRGPLRIGTSFTLSPRVVPLLAEHFTREHPAVDLRLTEGAPGDLQEDVLGGRLDLAIVYALQANEGVETIHIAPVRLHAILPAGHPLAGQDSVRLRDLVREPAVLLDVPPTIERLTGIVEAAGLRLDVRWTSPNMETIRSLVGRGLGFSFANSLPATGATFAGAEVVYRPIADRIPANRIVAVVPPGRPPRRVTEAIDLLSTTDTEGHPTP